MKLVLCSEGFHTNNTVQACVELCGKPQDKISFAIINEAFAVVEGDKRWVLDNLNDVAKNFPAEIDIIDLLALSLDEVEARIMQKDALFVVGGSSDYLTKLFHKTGFSKLLPKVLNSKVYVGSSAGSMVMGRRVPDEVRRRVFGEGELFEVEEYLGLVDLALIPHLDSPHFPNNRTDVLDEVAKPMSFPVYALRDDSALIVNSDKQKFIGSKPYKIS
ncbi:MAG TPA: Type 1 glutamine amidotransferase-like domain-containing protein [Candidatus Limnocylindria bacterium]|nr:Type 1 glutamine amidotransferase-like domain-containing protein [Candidatus Limnocylindria bacterium]